MPQGGDETVSRRLVEGVAAMMSVSHLHGPFGAKASFHLTCPVKVGDLPSQEKENVFAPAEGGGSGGCTASG